MGARSTVDELVSAGMVVVLLPDGVVVVLPDGMVVVLLGGIVVVVDGVVIVVVEGVVVTIGALAASAGVVVVVCA